MTPGEPVDGVAMPEPDEPEGETLVESATAWGRAILMGIRDTAQDALATGKRGAREAQDEYWRHFDDLTRNRRSKDRS